MRPLIIDDDLKDQISKLKAHANVNRRTILDLLVTDGKLPSKDARERAIKEAGLFFESLHESR